MDTDSIAQHSTKGISGVINRLKLKIYSLTGRFGLLPQISFLIVLILLCAGFTLAPTEQVKAAGISYTASQIGTLPVGSTRIVRAANDSGEIVGTAKDSSSGPKGFFGMLADAIQSWDQRRVAITVVLMISTIKVKSWVP